MLSDRSVIRAACAVVLTLVTWGFAQWPDYEWVQVTYYDYHSNGSCPDFEPSQYRWGKTDTGVISNMVGPQLDASRKPVLGSRVFFSQNLRYWFRPWVTGDYQLPNYDTTHGTLTGWRTSGADTGYKNMVFKDSLRFRHTSGGVYEYSDSAFFPLDNRGFGAEGAKDNKGNLHNFSFTMEIHRDFVYRPSLTFNFRGDDDVWVFINGRLVLDIGGIHGPVQRSFRLDSVNTALGLGLVNGRTYPLSMFYCERHVTGSDILLTTDLIQATRLDSLKIDAVPAVSAIKAGDSIRYTGSVYIDSIDASGVHHSIYDPVRSNQISWAFKAGTDTSGGKLVYPSPRSTNTFTATKAYKTFTIVASITDTLTGQVLTKELAVTVIANNPYALYIEGLPDTVAAFDKWAPSNRLDVSGLRIGSAQTGDTAYAILRDRYGNWTGSCTNSAWSSLNTSIVTAAAGANRPRGEGVILKVGPSGSAQVTAVWQDSSGFSRFRDTITVTIDPIAYDGLRFVKGPEGAQRVFGPSDTLVVRLTERDTIRAEAHRVDGLGADNGWVWINVPWTYTTSNPRMTVRFQPPTSAYQWEFAPETDTGRGAMGITLTSSTQLSATLRVKVIAGGPNAVVLFPYEGEPYVGGNDPYRNPSQLTYRWAAGSAYPLVGKVFDPANPPLWLSQFETDPAAAAYYSWKVYDASTRQEITDPAIARLSATSGHRVSFTPLRAGRTLDVVVSFATSQMLGILTDTIRILVVAGPVDRLVIEADSLPSSSDPTGADRLGQTTMRNTAGSVAVYAVLRDQYGNFIRFADSTAWESRDTAVVAAAMGPNARLGEGIITRRTSLADTTWVLATQAFRTDSVMVIISPVTYDSIQIYVLAGGARRITSLTMRTDQDTTLRARGKRSDNGQWVDVPVTWSSTGLTLSSAAPPWSLTWAFRPSAPATGRIKIQRDGTVGTVYDSIPVTVLPGLPRRLDLYPAEGTPNVSGNMPYPAQTVTDTVIAGAGRTLVAKILDHLNVWLSQYERSDAPITWQVTELTGNSDAPTGTLSPLSGHRAVFTPTRAYNTVDITATFNDGSGTVLTDAVRLYVKPDTALRLYIEPTPLRTASPHAANEITTISFGPRDTVKYGYAVLRDRFANYVGASESTDWTSVNATVVSALESSPAIGEGAIYRQARSGSTQVVARNRVKAWLFDTVNVVLSQITYDSLRIVVGAAAVPINNLTMRTDQDTTLFVQGKRSDNGRWEPVTGDWAITNGLRTTPPAPSSANNWKFAPNDTGSGRIMVSSGTAVPDTITVRFLHGLPVTIVLYPAAGTPGGANAPYPVPSQAIVDSAGKTVPVVAKVFDRNGLWLAEYERANAPVSWAIQELTGNPPTGTLNPTAGFQTSFVPTRAYNTVYVIARLSESGITCQDTIQVRVVPAAPHHLVLEADQNWQASPNRDNPVNRIEITSDQTYRQVYAMIRDAYGNFVKYSLLTDWQSLDTAVVTVEDGLKTVGEGTIKRVGDRGTTTVIAASQEYPGLKDTVDVVVQEYYFLGLQIYVLSGGVKLIDTLRIRTDQDTTLYARAQRSDTRQWIDVAAQWSSQGPTLAPVAPDNAARWTFSPSLTGTGSITATAGAGAHVVSDLVTVIVDYGLPDRMALYPSAGRPDSAGNTVYAPRDTIVAGVAFPIVAKLFDKKNLWLAQYERDDAPIAWTVEEVTGTGSTGALDRTTGFRVNYTARKAYGSIRITATFREGTITRSAYIDLYVIPGLAHHLVIEASADSSSSPNADNPINTVTLGSRDTVAYAYAVLRDAFGNFVSYAGRAGWQSLDTSVVTAGPGYWTARGQGEFVRQADTGTAPVVAWNLESPAMRDTVIVRLSNISYDSLRIVVGDSTVIDQLVMTTDDDTTVLVQGKRSDNGRWEYVPGSWSTIGDVQTTPAPPNASETWTFTPADTGSGRIVVSMGASAPDTIVVTVRHGLPCKLVLYPAIGAPGSANQPYPPPAEAQTDTAGRPFPLVAKVFDRNGVWLSDYEKPNSPITWDTVEISGNPPTGSLTTDLGFQTSYVPVRAYNRVYVIATFEEDGRRFLDTVQITVSAGTPRHIVIERSANPPPNASNAIDTVRISSRATFASVYAILRDSLYNLVGYSTLTGWSTTDSSLVTAADGNKTIGEGSIRKDSAASSGHAQVVARSLQYPGLVDTAVVQVLEYYFTELRVVDRPGDTAAVTSVSISTNDNDTLYVIGRRSDNGQWAPVSADWHNSPNLRLTPEAPENDSRWAFSPDTAGSGWIWVTMGADSLTAPDSVPVTFTRGEPTSVQIEIITPAGRLIAGDTIVAVVRIRNADGLVPGVYCYDGDSAALYRDKLPSGGRPDPVVITGSDSARLGLGVDECFREGVDTVRFVLYYAPVNRDSTHTIAVGLKGLSASTGPFVLLPGPMSRLVLEYANGAPVDTAVSLAYPGGAIVMFSRSYDAYGNLRGDERSNWTTTGTLHEIQKRNNVSRVYYDASAVVEAEDGLIIAQAVDTSGGIVADTVRMRVGGPMITVTRAVTRDLDGDGYLDAVELHFSKPVSLDNTLRNAFKIEYGAIVFSNDSIAGRDSAIDTVFILYLAEDSTVRKPQTNWTPYYSIAGVEGVDSIPERTVRCVDGAGPVIWRVIKIIEDPADRSKDRVQVVFSESIVDSTGQSIALNTAPSSLFGVYLRTADGDFVPDTSKLAGIGSLVAIRNDSIVEFLMTNGTDLGPSNYLNINTAFGIVTDKAGGNRPIAENRLVRVEVTGHTTERMAAVPNPTLPNFSHYQPGVFNAWHEPQAAEWVRRDGSGAVLRFPMTIPDAGDDQRVKVMVKIYDLVGNMVQSTKLDDILSPPSSYNRIPRDVSSFTVDLYWNGSNANGMPVAPGTYRVVVYLDYASTKYDDVRVYTTVGIGK